MVKRGMLFILGFRPILIGYLMNFLMMKFNLYGLSIQAMSILFAIYWYHVGLNSYKLWDSMLGSIMSTNVIGLMSLLLLIAQMIILNQYSLSLFGILPQMYFLSIMPLVVLVDVFNIFNHVMTLYGLCFLFMIALFYLGYRRGMHISH